jgi:hypothetical protein
MRSYQTFQEKKKEYIKGRIDELETNSRIKSQIFIRNQLLLEGLPT